MNFLIHEEPRIKSKKSRHELSALIDIRNFPRRRRGGSIDRSSSDPLRPAAVGLGSALVISEYRPTGRPTGRPATGRRLAGVFSRGLRERPLRSGRVTRVTSSRLPGPVLWESCEPSYIRRPRKASLFS